ncbi:hypothetical protein OBP_030 [Pseudomonas phage OBP]|uniref:hypothetical protein n=1 Tax=Pseudomonas phage OBP TaxID=1124849 RepID=UPI000240D61B|nr:hypothetical protein OBP_030 [Pseudomonas phage OBP]AEV89467.1 hypothetical protein OBP_030 [Pseudomonas phage OBP]
MKSKHVKKELVEIMFPIMQNLSKYGTEEFELEFKFQHNGVPYKVEHVVQSEHNRLEVKICDYYGIYPMFHVPIQVTKDIEPKSAARAFVHENPHLPQTAYRILKKVH